MYVCGCVPVCEEGAGKTERQRKEEKECHPSLIMFVSRKAHFEVLLIIVTLQGRKIK